jgi:hypothetical protein
MADDSSPATPDDTLAWEAENTRRAGLFALAAAVLTITGSIVTGLANAAAPKADDRILTIVDTLGRAAAGRPIPPGRFATILEYFGQHPAPFIAGGILIGLGALLTFPPLAFLYRAARARGPAPRLALIAAAAGCAGFGIGQAVSRTAFFLAAADFADARDHSNSAAIDVQNAPAVLAGNLIGQIGGLMLAIAFVLICIHAMRVGLLTRFTGVIGMFVGGTIVIAKLDPFGIVRSFWLGAVAVLLLGRMPRGRPPAWSVAEAVPWPTQQQVREQRMAARRERGEPEVEPRRPSRRRGGDSAGAADDVDGAPPESRAARVPAPRAPRPRRDDPAPGRPHPSSKKRKRKRRS